MNFELEFELEAREYDQKHFPPLDCRHYPEAFYIATDSGIMFMEQETLAEAVQYFHKATQGDFNCALYLIQDTEVLACYNGGQTDPEGETFWHVQESNRAEWLDALANI